MEQPHKTHKVRDWEIGCIGWFVIGNLALWLSIVAVSKNIEVPIFFVVPVITVIVIVILFIMKRNRFAYGVTLPSNHTSRK